MNLIFDVDGTLWDSTDVVAEAYNRVIETETELTVRTDGLWLKKLFGKPMDEICAAIFQGLPKEEQLALGERCFEYENEYLETHPGTLFDGVRDTLERLSETHRLYIVSNCQKGYIEVFLKGTGLAPLFSGHLCFGDTGTPKGETIRRLMTEKGMDEAVYIGDTQGDADASAAADIPFVFAAYGFGSVKEAWKTIDSFEQLTEIL